MYIPQILFLFIIINKHGPIMSGMWYVVLLVSIYEKKQYFLHLFEIDWIICVIVELETRSVIILSKWYVWSSIRKRDRWSVWANVMCDHQFGNVIGDQSAQISVWSSIWKRDRWSLIGLVNCWPLHLCCVVWVCIRWYEHGPNYMIHIHISVQRKSTNDHMICLAKSLSIVVEITSIQVDLFCNFQFNYTFFIFNSLLTYLI